MMSERMLESAKRIDENTSCDLAYYDFSNVNVKTNGTFKEMCAEYEESKARDAKPQMEWVSIKDRLPDDGSIVMVIAFAELEKQQKW